MWDGYQPTDIGFLVFDRLSIRVRITICVNGKVTSIWESSNSDRQILIIPLSIGHSAITFIIEPLAAKKGI